jgi:hypothetical protein
MWGDFFQNFGLNDLLQAFKAASAQPQLPFAEGQVDPQGGVFGATAGAPPSSHMPGMGAGGRQQGAGELGAPPGTQGAELAKPLPTASAVAARPSEAFGSRLSPGGTSPLAPGQMGLDRRTDEMAGGPLPDMYGGPVPRRFADLMR